MFQNHQFICLNIYYQSNLWRIPNTVNPQKKPAGLILSLRVKMWVLLEFGYFCLLFLKFIVGLIRIRILFEGGSLPRIYGERYGIGVTLRELKLILKLLPISWASSMFKRVNLLRERGPLFSYHPVFNDLPQMNLWYHLCVIGVVRETFSSVHIIFMSVTLKRIIASPKRTNLYAHSKEKNRV